MYVTGANALIHVARVMWCKLRGAMYVEQYVLWNEIYDVLQYVASLRGVSLVVQKCVAPSMRRKLCDAICVGKSTRCEQLVANDWDATDCVAIDWIAIDWIASDWIAIDWIAIDWIAIDWSAIDRIAIDWTAID